NGEVVEIPHYAIRPARPGAPDRPARARPPRDAARTRTEATAPRTARYRSLSPGPEASPPERYRTIVVVAASRIRSIRPFAPPRCARVMASGPPGPASTCAM